jgi:Putative transposase
MHYEWSLERLCRYAGRPPLATERLSLLPDGRLLYRLKRRWRDGTTHVIYEPLELMERLAALVHPPRFNITRYFGILAPAASLRPRVIPEAEASSPLRHPAVNPESRLRHRIQEKRRKSVAVNPRNYSWATLMERVFEVDVLACPRCGGRMRILAAIDSPDAIQSILTCLGLPTRAPPIAPAISDPDVDYPW